MFYSPRQASAARICRSKEKAVFFSKFAARWIFRASALRLCARESSISRTGRFSTARRELSMPPSSCARKSDPQEIKSLAVESYQRLIGRGATDPEKWAPKSRETADHSVPFCVAAALLDGGLTAAYLRFGAILGRRCDRADGENYLCAKIRRSRNNTRQNGTAAWSRTLSPARGTKSTSRIPRDTRKTRFRMPRSKKSFSGWPSRRSEGRAVERLSTGPGGWSRRKISARFFRCWQFLID